MSIDDYRAIADAALMRERGLFVAEGRIVVRRVIEDPRFRVESLLVNDAARRELGDAIDRLPSAVGVYVRGPGDLEAIAGYPVHRGCLALVHRPPPLALASLLSTGGTLVMLEAVTDPDNVGGIFRNAAAFGAAGVVLSPTTCDPLYRKAVRTSMAAVLHVPFTRVDDWTAALSRAREAGFTLAALSPREPSEGLDQFAARRRGGGRLALIVGAEGAGVSTATEGQADVRVRIPMSAGVDSLNLSVAAAIALYALRKQEQRS